MTSPNKKSKQSKNKKAVLDPNRVQTQTKTKSLGDVSLRYVSGGDIRDYARFLESDFSQREFLLRVLFHQLVQPKITYDTFKQISDKEAEATGKAFVQAESHTFKYFEDTGSFFVDFHAALKKYLDDDIKRQENLLKPFKKEAEDSLKRTFETIRGIQKSFPNIALPVISKTPDSVDSLPAISSPEVVREQNSWQRHKELVDLQDSSLEIQKAMLNEQKNTSFLTKIILILTVVMLLVSGYALYTQISTQQAYIANQEYPFFQYLYDPSEKLFKIESHDYVRINAVKWMFPIYEEGKVRFHITNSLTKDLSWFEIRDYFAYELSDKLSVERDFVLVLEDVECLFFGYAREGIPVIVEVDYDLRDQQNLQSKDFVLLQRLDTELSDIKFVETINDNHELAGLLNEYYKHLQFAYNPTVEMVNKLESGESYRSENGECRVRFDQPREGF